MSFSHANCDHPKTPKARAACRKARGGSATPEPFLAAPPETIREVRLGTMSQADARRIATELLEAHNLQGWVFRFDNSRRRAGLCNFGRRFISLSTYLLAQRTYDDSYNTITHEIAHALTPGEHHSPVWAAKHRELGGDGARCFVHVDEQAPWSATCSGGQTYNRYRQPPAHRTYRCRCHKEVLTWVKR